jgi:hypothetical protein
VEPTGLGVADEAEAASARAGLSALREPELIPRMLRSMGLPDEQPVRASARPSPKTEFEFDQ